MTRVAAIDCGTNSIRLLVAETTGPGGAPGAGPAGGLRELDRRMRIVRLGQGVDRTGRLAPEALERTFAACREYAEVIRGLGAERIRFVATSASRDAENRDDFVRGVVGILGVEPEVITGDREAEFSFTGAVRELAGGADAGGARGGFGEPYLVVDIGGGSTEFVIGGSRPASAHAPGGPGAPGPVSHEAARSVDIGCVRLTERHLLDGDRLVDPPTPDRIAALERDVAAALDLVEETVPLRRAGTLVGLAGSVTTVAAVALGLPEYDSAAIHHARISLDQVDEVTRALLAATHAERAAIPVVHPGRVDVIASGALILRSVMRRAGVREVLVSEHDILDGIAHHTANEVR